VLVEIRGGEGREEDENIYMRRGGKRKMREE
jgi:hypothetical protein